MNIILEQINAPYAVYISASTLAACLQYPALARIYPGHLNVFFDEVDYQLQLEFIRKHNITEKEYNLAKKLFNQYQYNNDK